YFNETHRLVMKAAYNADVKVGDCLFDYMTSEADILKAKQNYAKGLSGITHTTSEQYGDLEIKTYETIYSPIKNARNEIIGVTAYSRDVSERVNAAKALKDEKELAQKYLDIAAVMILVLDKNGDIVLVNKAGCEILASTENNVIGKNWFDNFIPKNEVNQVKSIFNKVYNKSTELTKHYENLIINARGEERYISWYNSILYDSESNIIGVLSSGEDITENKITHEKLKESEQRYRQLIGNLDAGILIHASDTSIVSFNKRAEEILGLSYAELSGVTASSKNFNFIDSAYNILDVSLYPINIILKRNSPIKDYIIGIKHIHDKKLVWVSVNGVPLFNKDNSIREIVISFVDISNEKNKQDEIIHLSNHDFLTGLHNRRFFVEKFRELDNKSNYPLGIMMVDVNGLKIINDAFGH
ncbi:MAG: hypothetical protein CVV60_06790, partial [Tenericutes bacterium HGW-Tenericutes-5]